MSETKETIAITALDLIKHILELANLGIDLDNPEEVILAHQELTLYNDLAMEMLDNVRLWKRGSVQLKSNIHYGSLIRLGDALADE